MPLGLNIHIRSSKTTKGGEEESCSNNSEVMSDVVEKAGRPPEKKDERGTSLATFQRFFLISKA